MGKKHLFLSILALFSSLMLIGCSTDVFCKIKVQKIAKENTQACQPSNQYLFLT
ncbi:hypothetical protein H7992_11530 [Sporosarcina sp. resist]|uniref:hypothetical protein n=1 Tax=Sporosarcina sp. resist TaxID=2762563 RepID=UPI00164E179C|nr:hypothetical protein [Sporosarcina sp. resist]QNK90225.1 hypothetical protein H7992_11530 [Sporosarcina sp. resist]